MSLVRFVALLRVANLAKSHRLNLWCVRKALGPKALSLANEVHALRQAHAALRSMLVAFDTTVAQDVALLYEDTLAQVTCGWLFWFWSCCFGSHHVVSGAALCALTVVCLFVYLSVCLSVCLSCLPLCLTVCAVLSGSLYVCRQ